MTNTKQELHDIVSDFDTAMLVTHTPDGRIHARPMAIAKQESVGNLWFFTSLESGKIGEISTDAHCGVVMQGNRKQISLSGHAEIIRDRAKIDALWKSEYGVWFEEGKDDPNVALIRFIGEQGEYWDNSAPKLLRRVLDVAKAAWRQDPASTASKEKITGQAELHRDQRHAGSNGHEQTHTR